MMDFSFKTKLNISKKIGLPSDYFDALNSINTLRNKLSHRIGYQVQESELNVIKSKVDRIDIGDSLLNCEQITTTRVYHIGGNAESETRNWQSSDINNKLVIIFVILAIKLTTWIQKRIYIPKYILSNQLRNKNGKIHHRTGHRCPT